MCECRLKVTRRTRQIACHFLEGRATASQASQSSAPPQRRQQGFGSAGGSSHRHTHRARLRPPFPRGDFVEQALLRRC
jgi:hypothetical protein